MKSTSGHSNVDSTTGCVETAEVERTRRLLRCWFVFLVAFCLSLTAGCVETAECNATVSCPSGQVCYAYTCRDRCETQQECGDGQTCTPCMDAPAGSDDGECFGQELQACVPEK